MWDVVPPIPSMMRICFDNETFIQLSMKHDSPIFLPLTTCILGRLKYDISGPFLLLGYTLGVDLRNVLWFFPYFISHYWWGLLGMVARAVLMKSTITDVNAALSGYLASSTGRKLWNHGAPCLWLISKVTRNIDYLLTYGI